ncbi:MAG: LapA family protein, partial [Anaerolineales bacterium]
MMQILLIFSLIIAFLAILFAIQNTEIVSIRFLLWETQGSLALILFIALVAGALISYLATTPGQIRQRMANSSQRKQIAQLENQLATTQSELTETNEKLQAVEAEKLAAEESESTPSESPEE